jgi:hypothetical protein
MLQIVGDQWKGQVVLQKIRNWFWCAVFGELYGSAVETRMVRDLLQVVSWVNGGPVPATVREAAFSAERLESLRTRQSAAYKGVIALLLNNGVRDLETRGKIMETMYLDENFDMRPIFNKGWCATWDYPPSLADSVINKTILSNKTLRRLANDPPSSCLRKLGAGSVRDGPALSEVLSTHLIDAKLLQEDDFDAFFEARKRALMQSINSAMGRVTEDLPVAAE